MIERDQIEEDLRQRVSKLTGIESDKIEVLIPLRRQLDSLDVAYLLVQIESQYGIIIRDYEIHEFTSIESLTNLILEKQSDASA